ncbi:MAG TPA: hypothetical protein VGR77_07140, partial [Candidatus Dormibacteraeota bacterium]|nr:hypothetical protein [Candidatus Dormibacteraeota bacterium]
MAIEVRPVAPGIIRLHIGAGAARASRLLDVDAPASTDWSVDENATGWSVYTSAVSLDIDREPYRLRLKDASGNERFV